MGRGCGANAVGVLNFWKFTRGDLTAMADCEEFAPYAKNLITQVRWSKDSTTLAAKLIANMGGGKQGNVYLLDRAHMPGDLTKRQPCSEDPSSDRSLLAPEAQPQFGRRGPLNVFGPYTEVYGMGDQARSRTTLAWSSFT